MDEEDFLCTAESISEIIVGDDLQQYDIVDLKPYQRYNISVALMSITRLGLSKGPITVKTLEGGKFEFIQHMGAFFF